MLAFGLSLLFMYMVLAAQFESFLHPITILLALPLTIPFALLSLVLLGEPLGHLRDASACSCCSASSRRTASCRSTTRTRCGPQGMPRDEAILEANHVRLRPILMTTVMLVAAWSRSRSARAPARRSRAAMAKVIIGGQTLSLLLTLLITPVAYSLFDDAIAWGVGERVRRLGRRLLGRAEPARPGPRAVPAEIVRTADTERKSA